MPASEEVLIQAARMRAENFFYLTWGDEEMGVHSSCVVEAATSMATGTDLNLQVLITAGWLHDLGRKDDVENHHIAGLLYAEKFLEMYPSCKNIEEEIYDCIKNHRSSGSPATVYGRIIQAADKAAFHNYRWIEFCRIRRSK